MQPPILFATGGAGGIKIIHLSHLRPVSTIIVRIIDGGGLLKGRPNDVNTDLSVSLSLSLSASENWVTGYVLPTSCVKQT